MKTCGLCDFASEDDAAFAEHMMAVHRWGALTAPAKPLRGTARIPRALTGCLLSAVVFVFALGMTGSFGFQKSLTDGLAFELPFIAGLGGPPVAAVYLLWQLSAALFDAFGQQKVEPAQVAIAEMRGTLSPPSGMPAVPRRAAARLSGMSQSTALTLLVFVLVAGAYLWSVSDPNDRDAVPWFVLVRDAAIGFIAVWFLSRSSMRDGGSRRRGTRASCPQSTEVAYSRCSTRPTLSRGRSWVTPRLDATFG